MATSLIEVVSDLKVPSVAVVGEVIGGAADDGAPDLSEAGPIAEVSADDTKTPAAKVVESAPVVEEAVGDAAEPAVAPEAEALKNPKDASRFAALARRDAQLTRKQREIAAQTKALEAQRATDAAEREALRKELAEAREAVSRVTKMRETARTNPKAILDELELDLETAARAYMPGAAPKPEDMIAQLQKQIAKLTSDQEARDAAAAKARDDAEAAAKQRQAEAAQRAALDHIHAQIDKTVTTGGDDLEFVRLHDEAEPGFARTEILGVIEYVYRHGGEMIVDGKKVRWRQGTELPVALAAKLVETHLTERARKLASAKKLRPADTTDEASTEETATTGARVSKSPSRTISNLQGTAPVVVAEERRLSKDESIREAAKLLRQRK